MSVRKIWNEDPFFYLFIRSSWEKGGHKDCPCIKILFSIRKIQKKEGVDPFPSFLCHCRDDDVTHVLPVVLGEVLEPPEDSIVVLHHFGQPHDFVGGLQLPGLQPRLGDTSSGARARLGGVYSSTGLSGVCNTTRSFEVGWLQLYGRGIGKCVVQLQSKLVGHRVSNP